MAAAAARNLRDPRAAAAAPGIPPSLDNPKHKHDLPPAAAPGSRPLAPSLLPAVAATAPAAATLEAGDWHSHHPVLKY